MDENYACCFIGHRRILKSSTLRERLYDTIEHLITRRGVYRFLFGSKSEFDALCLEIVTELKVKYRHIKRVYVRAEFQNIDEEYLEYLLSLYDDTYFPSRLTNTGRSVYIERNREMIDESLFCVVYFDESVNYNERKSGTALAFSYAVRKK